MLHEVVLVFIKKHAAPSLSLIVHQRTANGDGNAHCIVPVSSVHDDDDDVWMGVFFGGKFLLAFASSASRADSSTCH